MSTTRKINWDDYKAIKVMSVEDFKKEYLCDCTFESSSDVAKDGRPKSTVDFPRGATLEDFLVGKRGDR